jgi:hypothetical protein
MFGPDKCGMDKKVRWSATLIFLAMHIKSRYLDVLLMQGRH